MNDGTGTTPANGQAKIDSTYTGSSTGDVVGWTGTGWSARHFYDVVAYYTGVSQTGAGLWFAPLTKSGMASGGAYTVSNLITNDDVIAVEPLGGTNNAFKTLKTGVYLIEFSGNVTLNLPETDIILQFVANEFASDPFQMDQINIPVARVKTSGVAAPLSGRVVRSLPAGTTFGFRAFTQSSGAAAYYNATLTAKLIG